MKNLIITAAVGLIFAACQNNQKGNTQNNANNADTSAAAKLEEVFADSTCQLTGVTVSAGGRLFTNYPYWLNTHSYSVVEIKKGKPVPYPDNAWNSFKKGENGQNKFVCVQSVVADDKGYLWVIDAAGIGLASVYQQSNKVVKINLADNRIERIYRFPQDVAGADVSAAQVNLGAAFNECVNKDRAPFYIFRFNLLKTGVPFKYVEITAQRKSVLFFPTNELFIRPESPDL